MTTTTAMRTLQRNLARPDPAAAPVHPTRDAEGAPLGQAAAMATIEAFVDAADGGPAALLIEGEIGAGKSTLWQAGVAGAGALGRRVLVCRPSESESSMAFAGLGDLLNGTLDDQIGLPGPQLRALRVATLLEDPDVTPPDQRAVSVATLTLVRVLAARSPVLIAVDDAHCLDPATSRVLQFVLRRLTSEPVRLLAAQRQLPAGGGSRLGPVEIAGQAAETVVPAALGPESIDRLLRRQLDAGLPRPVLRQVVSASGGNPLFALEIARAIQRGEIVPNPPQRLGVPHTLQQLVQDRLVGLPGGQRDLLFVAAAVSDPTVDLLTRYNDGSDATEALAEALAAGVIVIDDGRVRFAHPLFGSTLYHAVPADRRRTLHGRLAALVAGSHERARQFSLAAAGPDPAVAEALDRAATAAAARGAPDGAADLAEQAVRLTPAGDREAMLGRRLHAAEFHFAAGDSVRARGLLEALVREVPAGPGRAAILCRLATVRYRSDSASIAADLLSRALEECDGDRALRAEIERDLAWAVTLCGDVADAERHAESALRMVDPSDDTTMLPELLAARALARFLRGHGLDSHALDRAAGLEPPVSRVPIEWRPRMILGMLHKWAGDVALARQHLDALHRESIEAGDEMSLPFLLSQLSETETLAGNFRLAVDWAEAANSLAEQTGQEPIRAFALYARALAQAHQGRVEAARDSAQEGLRLAEAAGVVVAMMLNQSVLGFIALSCEEPEQADAWLGPLVAWLDVVGIREPGVIRLVPDAAEALVALGQADRADALLRPFEADGARLNRGWAMLAAARARALYLGATGDRTRGIRLLQAAIDDHGPAAGPFATARALLVLGAALRRTRRRKAARVSLTQALERFEGLGAEVWAGRARALLGAAPAENGAPHEAQLTPAERRVVELVIAGSTNREAAARLFVSVRAVEIHLTNVYRKLAVRSRTELAALLSARPAAPSGSIDRVST